jgi:hypothetical protein
LQDQTLLSCWHPRDPVTGRIMVAQAAGSAQLLPPERVELLAAVLRFGRHPGQHGPAAPGTCIRAERHVVHTACHHVLQAGRCTCIWHASLVPKQGSAPAFTAPGGTQSQSDTAGDTRGADSTETFLESRRPVVLWPGHSRGSQTSAAEASSLEVETGPEKLFCNRQ